MFGQPEPQAAPASQGVPSPAYNPQMGNGYPPSGGGQTVMNPALGSLGQPVQLPQQQQQQPQYQQTQPQFIPNQQPNPYMQQQPQGPSPYAPMQQQNPYGPSQMQQSPYTAPPAPLNGLNQFQRPPQGQPMPPQQQPNPAYQFNPYAQQQPQVQQQAPQQLQQQPAPSQGQITAEQLSKQPQGITPEQVNQIFPDETSQAIYQGMDVIAKGQNIDLIQAFGSAYERRDASLINERYLAQFDQQTAAVLRGQFHALVQAGQQRDAQVEQSVYQMAGGQEQWKLAAQAFNTAADPQTKQAVTAALDSGDPNQIRLAAQAVLQYTGRQGNMIQRNGQSLTPNGGGQAPREVMTNEAFRQHLGWLEQAHAVGSPEYNRHYQNLVEQRRQAKAMGY